MKLEANNRPSHYFRTSQRFSSADRLKMLELHRKGIPFKYIAIRFHCSAATIRETVQNLEAIIPPKYLADSR